MRKIILNPRERSDTAGTEYRTYLKGFFSPIALITLVGVALGLSQYMLNNKRLRQAATMEYIVGFHQLLKTTTPMLLDTLNIHGYKGENYRLSSQTLESLLKGNDSYRREIDEIMSYVNRFAIGCRYDDFFDENTAWAADCRLITSTTYALVPYFQLLERERQCKTGQYACPFLRAMVYRWETLRSISKDYDRKLEKVKLDKAPQIVKRLFPSAND